MAIKKYKVYNKDAEYQTIEDAARTSGLSKYFLRKGCKDGTIPHVTCGNKTMIIMPLLLDAMSKQHKFQQEL